MAAYANLTPNSSDWKLHFQSSPYNECLVVLIILFYGLKIQLQKLNHQRNVNLIKEFKRKVVHTLITLMNWCAYMQDYKYNIIEKHVINAKVILYENKTIPQPERRKENKHPWDIAQEIMAEQRQAALAIRWATLPLETLMDKQFLLILHAIEDITDVTPLREAALQLPKKIYEIVRQHEQLTKIPTELTDQLIFDVCKTYYYSVIESLCRLIKSIQQGQRPSLVSLAKIIQEQRDEIGKYQALLKLPEEVKQLRLGLELKMEQLKKHVNMHLERMDKKTSVASVTISEIRSQIHRLENTMEGNFEHIPEPDSPSLVFPGDMVELHAPEDDIIFHEGSSDETPPNRQQQGENSTMGGEIQEEHGNITSGLSPPKQYIPAGAEGDEDNSSTSTYGEEETVEEGLANFFSNPSYRAANPDLLEPVDSEEDSDKKFPLYICQHKHHRNYLNGQQSLKKGRDIYREEEKEGDRMGGEEIIINIIWTIINNLKLKEEL